MQRTKNGRRVEIRQSEGFLTHIPPQESWILESTTVSNNSTTKVCWALLWDNGQQDGYQNVTSWMFDVNWWTNNGSRDQQITFAVTHNLRFWELCWAVWVQGLNWKNCGEFSNLKQPDVPCWWKYLDPKAVLCKLSDKASTFEKVPADNLCPASSKLA